jgi:hypothetical protein
MCSPHRSNRVHSIQEESVTPLTFQTRVRHNTSPMLAIAPIFALFARDSAGSCDTRWGYLTDTPRGFKPQGFSGEPSYGVSVSIPAAERLKAVPPPTRTLHAAPGERGSSNSGSSAGHLVQGTLLLFPVGTTDHGTGKQHGVGTVQDVLSPLLIQASRTGKGNRLLAHAKKRLTAWVETQRLAAGSSPFLSIAFVTSATRNPGQM